MALDLSHFREMLKLIKCLTQISSSELILYVYVNTDDSTGDHSRVQDLCLTLKKPIRTANVTYTLFFREKSSEFNLLAEQMWGRAQTPP